MVSRRSSSRQGRWAFGLTSGAVLWGLGLVLAAFVAPVYGGSESDSAGHVSSTSATLIQVNGIGVLLPISVPVVVAVLVWAALRHRCTHGGSATLAWVLTGLLLAFALVAVSIGVFILPLVALLAIAVRLTPSGPVASAPT